MKKLTTILVIILLYSTTTFGQKTFPNLEASKNSLNYKGNPTNATDRKSLAFSDKGAWFGFGFLDSSNAQAGFSGPYLLTEQNGVWISPSFVSLNLSDKNQQELINWKTSLVDQSSYNSHLEQKFQNEKLVVQQQLVFSSGQSAIQKMSITNRSSETIIIYPSFDSKLFFWILLVALFVINITTYIVALKLYQNLLMRKIFYFILYLCTLEIAPYYFMYYWFTKS